MLKFGSDGSVKVGGVVSAGGVIITTNVPVPVFPAASVVVQVTVVVPTGNRWLEAIIGCP